MKLGDMIEMRAAFANTLLELGAENPSVIVFDADVGASTYTARYRNAYPERFIQAGIAEQNMVGMAAGASTLGLIPWSDPCRAGIAPAENHRLFTAHVKTPWTTTASMVD